jgi:hypothetical protein
MKYHKTIFLLLLFTACGSFNSIDSFYEAHKNDSQVTAIRVPQFMLAMVGQISPEMKAMVGTTKDLRYMQFPSVSESQSQFLNNQMNVFSAGNFIEVFRKNDELKRNIVAIREKKNVVKEIIIYNNDNIKGSFLYFNGNFDPEQVRQMAKNNEFQDFSNGLLPQLNLQSPGITTD